MSIRILVVEDDELLLETIVDFLDCNDFQAFGARSINNALNLLYQKNADVVLLDIKLLDGSGVDLLKEIRSWNTKVPILMITSYTDKTHVTECLSNGADDYIRKPFDLDEMIARIQASVRRVYAGRISIIKLNNGFEFDIYTKRLLKDGQDTNLTKKENDLLAVLCANRGQILPFDILERSLWNTNQEASNGSLRVYINSLRKLLGEDSIISIKSVGYRLN